MGIVDAYALWYSCVYKPDQTILWSFVFVAAATNSRSINYEENTDRIGMLPNSMPPRCEFTKELPDGKL